MKISKLVGINHVALEVGDLEEALEFYSSLFDFELRGRTSNSAFIDMGDQFLALTETADASTEDDHRHFGLVVDDRERVREILAENNVEVLPGSFLDFRDPWGNLIQVVDYRNIQFQKTDGVLKAMGLSDLKKSEQALEELQEKGLNQNR